MLSAQHNGDIKQSECTCAPCKAFWRSAFLASADNIHSYPSDRAQNTAILGKQGGLIKKGRRVTLNGKQGVVQYVGLADDHLIAPDMKVGVALYDNVYSTHNGLYNGRRFFHCPRGHGAMVKYTEVTPLDPVPRTREIAGNGMFPSFEAVKKRRREREKKIKEAEDQLKKEHDLKRRAQMERLSNSKSAPPPPVISPRPTRASRLRTDPVTDRPRQPLQDEYDIAYQDHVERERQKEQRKPLDPKVREEMQFQRMKTVFGGDEKAERMAETLRKLHHGYEEGRIIAMAERE